MRFPLLQSHRPLSNYQSCLFFSSAHGTYRYLCVEFHTFSPIVDPPLLLIFIHIPWWFILFVLRCALKNLVQIITIAGNAANKLHRSTEKSDAANPALEFASALSKTFQNMNDVFEDTHYFRDTSHSYFEQQRIQYMENMVTPFSVGSK